jgi:hypothetical protein
MVKAGESEGRARRRFDLKQQAAHAKEAARAPWFPPGWAIPSMVRCPFRTLRMEPARAHEMHFSLALSEIVCMLLAFSICACSCRYVCLR